MNITHKRRVRKGSEAKAARRKGALERLRKVAKPNTRQEQEMAALSERLLWRAK